MFSVCIASRGPALGLWATIHACQAILPDWLKCEFIVCLNGQPITETHELLMEHCQVRLAQLKDPVPPPIARDFCVSEATGDILVFLDDHVLPTRLFFNQIQESFRKVKSLGALHSSYQPYAGYNRYYHFLPDPQLPTKGDYAKEPLSKAMYKCLSGPHGGFAVRKTAYDKVGGYGNWFQGFGGEEAYFDMKLRLAGWEVMLDPNLLFYHFSCRPETRGYDKSLNEWNYEEGMRRLGDVSSILKGELWKAR